jgi:hypothetical protein
VERILTDVDANDGDRIWRLVMGVNGRRTFRECGLPIFPSRAA